ncbi:hypothetical protein PBI_HILLTOPFARM_74 [Mycobacterium phage Hilltopfarm]|nr:hypothetical protein PBI_HILLTOPFARM_74 [Mycobacterium phage Hilltopfarm]
MTPKELRHERYLANPRRCVDCGGDPSAGRPRCDDCHKDYMKRGATQ